jgi:hypothetical protein
MAAIIKIMVKKDAADSFRKMTVTESGEVCKKA